MKNVIIYLTILIGVVGCEDNFIFNTKFIETNDTIIISGNEPNITDNYYEISTYYGNLESAYNYVVLSTNTRTNDTIVLEIINPYDYSVLETYQTVVLSTTNIKTVSQTNWFLYTKIENGVLRYSHNYYNSYDNDGLYFIYKHLFRIKVYNNGLKHSYISYFNLFYKNEESLTKTYENIKIQTNEKSFYHFQTNKTYSISELSIINYDYDIMIFENKLYPYDKEYIKLYGYTNLVESSDKMYCELQPIYSFFDFNYIDFQLFNNSEYIPHKDTHLPVTINNGQMYYLSSNKKYLIFIKEYNQTEKYIVFDIKQLY